MPFVRMPDGQVVEISNDALFVDATAQNPLSIPTGPVFTQEDIENARKQEKDKLYGRLEETKAELTALREQVGGLTAAEQRREAALKEEQDRLEAEARAREAEELDAKTLLQRTEQDWNKRLEQINQTWEQKFAEETAARQQSEALLAKEREFQELQAYRDQVLAENQDKIAPQLYSWVAGDSKEAVDAAVQRAIDTTNQIAEEMQQAMGGQQQVQVPGVPQGVPQQQTLAPLPGVRPTAGPPGIDPAAAGQQTLSPEQIANMPMGEWAKIRNQVIRGESNNRGLFG